MLHKASGHPYTSDGLNFCFAESCNLEMLSLIEFVGLAVTKWVENCLKNIYFPLFHQGTPAHFYGTTWFSHLRDCTTCD